jgi:hypothetical protein
MSGPSDYFTDLVLEGEPILATLAGPGPDGAEKVWIQLAVTPFRMVAVKLVQATGGSYQPALRQVVQKDTVRIRRFPRTGAAQARIEVWGFQKDPLVLVDVDEPAIFPSVEPFLEAWGGFVDGTPSFTRSRDPQRIADRGGARQLYLVAAAGVLLVFACGCLSTVGLAVRYLLGSP